MGNAPQPQLGGSVPVNGSQTATDNFKRLLELADGLTKVLGLAALIYIVAMGLVYRAGSTWGADAGRHDRQQQGKPVLVDLPDDDKPVLFWNDDKLIQGGLTGFAIIALLCSYIVFMILFSPGPHGSLLHSAVSLMGYPNSMAAVVVLGVFFPMRHSAGRGQWVVMIASTFFGVVTFLAPWFKPQNIARNQILILALQSFLSCYALGVATGKESVNFETRYPLVEVQTVDAQTITGLRMIKTADTETRFVRADGSQFIIPKLQIRYIRTVAPPQAPPPQK